MPTPQPVSPPDTTPIVVDDEEGGSPEVVGEELKNDIGDSQVSSIVPLKICPPVQSVELWRAGEAGRLRLSGNQAIVILSNAMTQTLYNARRSRQRLKPSLTKTSCVDMCVPSKSS